MFKSLSSPRRPDDIELGVPLFSSQETSSSVHNSPHPSSRFNLNLLSPRPGSPKPATPRTPNPFSTRRLSWRQLPSWQNGLIVILTIYFLATVLKRRDGGNALSGPAKIAEYGGGEPRRDLTHLVMVAGHAIWMGGSTLGVDEDEWTLLPYQHGAASTFVKHIEEGTRVAKMHEDSLLVFSGGETRNFAGPLSEAQSYWSLAYAKSLITPNTTLFPRTTTEEFSRDSYENLLFSICRFHEYTSNYPTHITVIGYEFKRKRFETVHRAALRYSLEKFTYIGIDPPKSAQEGRDLLDEELNKALKPFEQDPYGCWNELLVKKRKQRNPFRTRHGYEATCPEIADLMRWCGRDLFMKDKEQWYTGVLPWD